MEVTKCPSIETLTIAGAAAEIDDFLMVFGGRWPPRPSFDWPACFQSYHDIWEASTTKIKEINDPTKFREWMRQQLNGKVNMEEVETELGARMRLDDPVTLGLQACLQYTVCFYRWGSLPTNDEERQRTKLEFPDQLWIPFTKIADLYGTSATCCIFNCSHANFLYNTGENKPVTKRYWWNSDDAIRQSENNFFLSFVLIDNAFDPLLRTIRDYLVYTDAARSTPEVATALLPKRIQQLKTLRSQFLFIHKLFINAIQMDKVDKESFPDYIQNMAAWGLDGEGGASGAEALTFALLDDFLDLGGDSEAYAGALSKRTNMTRRARQLLEKMAADHPEDRFNSFLEQDEKENPIIQAKDDLIKSIYIWRLGHARSSTEFMENSKITASKIVENSIQEGVSIADHGLFMGTVRARETAQKIVNKSFKILDLDAPTGYKSK